MLPPIGASNFEILTFRLNLKEQTYGGLREYSMVAQSGIIVFRQALYIATKKNDRLNHSSLPPSNHQR